MWNELKTNEDVIKFFPNYSKSRLPTKGYLMNVINTIQPNSIITAIQKLKKERDKHKQVKEPPIKITKHYLKLLSDF